MKTLQKGSTSIVLALVILLLVGLAGYFVLSQKTTAPTADESTPSSDITITFPKADSVILEGQTYNITWSAHKSETTDNDRVYIILFEWGCLKDGSGCGGGRTAQIKDIYSQSSVPWTVPDLKTYLQGGDSSYHKILPDDLYKITLYSYPAGGIVNAKTYSSPMFKIIPATSTKTH